LRADFGKPAPEKQVPIALHRPGQCPNFSFPLCASVKTSARLCGEESSNRIRRRKKAEVCPGDRRGWGENLKPENYQARAAWL